VGALAGMMANPELRIAGEKPNLEDPKHRKAIAAACVKIASHMMEYIREGKR
jgi:hypothetical protein